MSFLNLQASYFAIENPLRLLGRWVNRPRHHATVRINQREVELGWSERAEAEMQRSDRTLIVELQLYFSCVVKKRVLFHRQPVDFETVRVNNRLQLAFRPIASAICDPREFAESYPVGRELTAAARMVPRRVQIDYRQGHWEGHFQY